MTTDVWARALLVLSALLVVPLGMRLVNRIFASSAAGRLRRMTSAIQAPAAVLLIAAQSLSSGPLAAALAAPWALVSMLVAAAGVLRLWRAPRGPLAEAVAAVGMLYLAIGGGWVLLDRAGMRPLGLEPAIVLLTGIHFHFAGFALPVLAGLASRRLAAGQHSPTFQRLSLVGVAVSVPLVAVGITASQVGLPAWLELSAAGCMSLSGLSVAWLYLRLAFDSQTGRLTRELWAFCGLLLAGGMILSLVYGGRSILPATWLDIPRMIALHGTANALGFTIPAFVGWHLQTAAETAETQKLVRPGRAGAVR